MPWTGNRIASKLADTHNQLYVAACTGDIGHETGVVTADVCGGMSTQWAEAACCCCDETDGKKLVCDRHGGNF